MVEGSDPPCKACGKDTYAPSGAETSCTSCPNGKTVPSGQGASVSDCTWGELLSEKDSRNSLKLNRHRIQ